MAKKKIKKIAPVGTMCSNGNYEWHFSTIGGVTRVNITTGSDIEHLGELDQKLWTVLSCPASGLEMDPVSLKLLDIDGDGKIHVNEVIQTVEWLKPLLKDFSVLIDRPSSLKLSDIRTDTAEGKSVYDCAKQILKNAGLKKEEISLADAAESLSIFAKNPLNGDGVVTENSTTDEGLKAIIKDCIATMGAVADRSGDPGADSDKIAAFYKATADYVAWKDAGVKEIFPFGDKTADALSACEALKDKVADFFMRCKLAAFHSEGEAVLDVTSERLGAISSKDLSACSDEIAAYPLAKVNAAGELPLDGVNPAWKAAFDSFKTLVAAEEFPKAKSITEEKWNEVLAKFDAYKAWMGAKAGIEVESLGYDRLQTVLKENRKEEVDALIASDKAFESEVNEIQTVDKLLHICRDFYTLLRNYVTFSDFYSTKSTISSVFQAGRLYIDQRNCDLCIKVTDMAKQNAMAGMSGMFLIYCDCVSKTSPAKMTIVAVMTDGDINNLKEGCNAIFYDRQGNDWDAVVTKIVNNPISVRQAFWSPYKKMGDFVEKQINKIAAKQDSKVLEKATADLTSAGSAVAASATAGASAGATAATPAATTAQTFDVAKFAGIFAMVGMALGSIGTFLGSLYGTFMSLSAWAMIGSVLGLILIISGPSMIMSWLSLRKRNLAPLLNANGWAVNAKVIVNVRFGKTLTGMPKMPVIVGNDPFAEKQMPRWKKVVISIAAVLVIALAGAAWWYFSLPKEKRPFPKAKTEVVETSAEAAPAAAEATVDAAAVEAPAAETAVSE